VSSSADGEVQIVPASELEKHKDSQLVCPSLERRPVTDFLACNVDVQLPRAIFIRKDTTSVEQETVKHLFSLISDKFGAHGKLVDVFALFGEFQAGKKNVYFHVSASLSIHMLRNLKMYLISQDKAVQLVTEIKNEIQDEQIYADLQCDANKIAKQ